MTWRGRFLKQTVFRTRRSTVAALLSVQTILLVLVFLLLFLHIEQRLIHRAICHTFVQNRGFYSRIAEAVSGFGLTEVAYGDAGWERLQELIERLPLPHGGEVYLLEAAGRVLCHPALRRDPSLRDAHLGLARVEPLSGSPLRLAEAASHEPLLGFKRNSGQTKLVAVGRLPELDARLVVETSADGLALVGRRAITEMLLPGALFGAAVLAITAAISFSLIRRHDQTLELVNGYLKEEVQRRVQQSLATRNALIFGLAKLADYRDTDTGRHLERICAYTVLLARRLRRYRPELTDAWVDHLRVATSLHDIGKVGIPDHVLLKPGVLTLEEREIMERHPIIGADTLLAVREKLGEDDLVNLSIQIALSHHERWDGNGYPCGLSGEEIPLAARLVALADVYDALTSKRIYKPALSHTMACQLIRSGAGTQFDPAIVRIFEEVADEFDACRRSLEDSASFDLFRLALTPNLRNGPPPAEQVRPRPGKDTSVLVPALR